MGDATDDVMDDVMISSNQAFYRFLGGKGIVQQHAGNSGNHPNDPNDGSSPNGRRHEWKRRFHNGWPKKITAVLLSYETPSVIRSVRLVMIGYPNTSVRIHHSARTTVVNKNHYLVVELGAH